MIEVLQTATLQMLRRRKGSSFSPEDVLRQLYPEDWELFLPELYDTLVKMNQLGLISLEFGGTLENLTKIPHNQVKIRKPNKLI